MALAPDDLTALSLGRQFPAGVDSLTDLVAATGPIQSQTARSPFIGLAARRPGTTHAELSSAYERGEIVRGSTIRGTVHTSTPEQYAALSAATRVGQRALFQRLLGLERGPLDDLWASTEEFAAVWRTPDELEQHLREWLLRREGRTLPESGSVVRYLSFGHGGLVRRPVAGSWSGQGAPAYRALGQGPASSVDDAVLLHVRCHGPVTRHDTAWWSGLGLRAVDEAFDRLGLVGVPGPGSRTFFDAADTPAPRDLVGARLLPEFDALMCAYDPSGRDRFADPVHLRRLWTQKNGLVLPPLLVDGRITGWWRAGGTARRRRLEVTWFAGTRRLRKAELESPVAGLEAALDIVVTDVTLTREVG